MAPKSKTKEPDEDISQLRKPITLHGKPVEQILNSIHYGSPELRNLLLSECDIIFECKVCRALFRDLPNFISHKRRFCSKSVAELNHFTIGESPDERVIIVQPQAVDESEIAKAQSSSSSSRPNLDDTLQQIRAGEIGNSFAFQVYTNAAAKLRHQKDHTRITSLRPREIPTNSNAVFVDVKTTSVNIHDRVQNDETDSDVKSNRSAEQTVSSNRRKAGAGKKRVNSLSNNSNNNEKRLRNRSSTHNNKATSKKCDELTDRLIQELKVIRNKSKGKSQENQHSQVIKDLKPDSLKDDSNSSMSALNDNNRDLIGAKSRGTSLSCDVKTGKDKDVFELRGQHFKDDLHKKVNSLTVSKNNGPQSYYSVSSDDSGEEVDDDGDHEKITGKSKRSLICSGCQGIFSSRKSLQFHMKTHHSVKTMFYPCPLCSNVYYYYTTLTRHLRINHNKTKKEVDEMNQMLKAKAFSKASPSQESSTRTGVKLGTRQSSRYKDKFISRRIGNAPFIFSSITKGKKVSAKRDPALNGKYHKSEKPVSKESVDRPEISNKMENEKAKQTKSCESELQHKKSFSLACQSASNKARPGEEAKSFKDIGMQMQTCPKCSRLFGRKSTYEKHIIVCSGKIDILCGSENDSKIVKDMCVDNSVNQLSSTRSKVRDTRAVSPSSSNAHKTAINSQTMRVATSAKKDQIDVEEASEKLSRLKDSSHSSPPEVVSRNLKVSLRQCKDLSPVKLKAEDSGHSLTPRRNIFSSLQDEMSPSFLRNVKNEQKDGASSNVISESSLTRTRSRGDLDISDCNALAKPDCGDTKLDKNLPQKDGVGVDKKSPVQERPKRKRKVPSRNLEAIAMLQKIQHTVRAESSSSEKRARYLDAESNEIISSKRQNTVLSAPELNGHGSDVDNTVFQRKRRSSKIFVSNNNKLECYNLSKAEKFMNMKKFKCRKCGTTFSSKTALKTHVVRKHLRWSRFQCKLCSFNCFFRSECCIHINRSHFNKGNKLHRNQSIGSLIIDLSKKGSEALTLKKSQTIKAKSQQLQEEEKDNIYKNHNAHKHPRLPERKLERTCSSSQSMPTKQQNENKLDAISGSSKKEKTSPSSSSTDSHNDKDKMIQSRRLIVSHLVPRMPRLPQSIPTSFGNSEINPAPVSSEKRSHLLQSTASVSKSDDEDMSVKSITSTSSAVSNSGSSNSSSKRTPLPFNISTRKSPRVFDTSPYNRGEIIHGSVEETTTPSPSANQVVLHTRHGAYTKILPAIPLKEPPKSAGFKNDKIRVGSSSYHSGSESRCDDDDDDDDKDDDKPDFDSEKEISSSEECPDSDEDGSCGENGSK